MNYIKYLLGVIDFWWTLGMIAAAPWGILFIAYFAPWLVVFVMFCIVGVFIDSGNLASRIGETAAAVRCYWRASFVVFLTVCCMWLDAWATIHFGDRYRDKLCDHPEEMIWGSMPRIVIAFYTPKCEMDEEQKKEYVEDQAERKRDAALFDAISNPSQP